MDLHTPRIAHGRITLFLAPLALPTYL